MKKTITVVAILVTFLFVMACAQSVYAIDLDLITSVRQNEISSAQNLTLENENTQNNVIATTTSTSNTANTTSTNTTKNTSTNTATSNTASTSTTTSQPVSSSSTTTVSTSSNDLLSIENLLSIFLIKSIASFDITSHSSPWKTGFFFLMLW